MHYACRPRTTPTYSQCVVFPLRLRGAPGENAENSGEFPRAIQRRNVARFLQPIDASTDLERSQSGILIRNYIQEDIYGKYFRLEAQNGPDVCRRACEPVHLGCRLLPT